MSAPDPVSPVAADVDLYDYDLPPERIAQEPAPRREDARLLVLPRSGGAIEHGRIADLPRWLGCGDLLVVNDTRVRACRLFGRKRTGGEVETLLLERVGIDAGGGELWTALLRASRRPRAGAEIDLEGGLGAVVQDVADADGAATLRLLPPPGGSVEQVMERSGRVPLPPYIHRERHDRRDRLDRERYQTVYARDPGSAAAPTAGLHLSPGLLRTLEERGVSRAEITLHVGRGTFQPVRSRRLDEHTMHAEWCRVTPQAAASIRRTRAAGGRVVAVGTTVVRALEARGGEAGEGPVDLFIRPGHRFRVIDALVTNFHLPRSTLLVLVSAFAGRERVLDAYRQALEAGYRFYSYGDAMLVH